MPGRMSGKVTFQNVAHSFAPRSIAASSRWRGKPGRRAFTVTTTKLMLNMMWAMMIVRMLSGKTTPSGMNGSWSDAMNVVRSDAPSTISGVDIGRKISRFVRAPAAES